MALLVLAIVIFAILSRLGTQGSFAEQTGILGREQTENYVNVNIQTVLYSTAKGIPLSELIGDYMCYGDNNPDYGTGKINLENEIRTRLNNYYGKDKWILYVNATSTTTFVPQIVIVFDGSGSMVNKDFANPLTGLTNYEAVYAAIRKVSPTSRIWLMEDQVRFGTSLFGERPANNCDLSNNKADPGMPLNSLNPNLRPQTDESWANVASFVAVHGPPLDNPPYFNGWPPDVPKIVFISSDERACNIGPTIDYVDNAIVKAKANGVKFYFIVPPMLYAEPRTTSAPNLAANAFVYNQMKRLSEETGGKAVNLTSVAELAIEIENAARIQKNILREFTIDSSSFTSNFRTPQGAKSVLAYPFPLPTPCTVDIDANAMLFIKS